MPSWVATGWATAASVGGASAQDGGLPRREGRARIVVDTDAANYFDDQFALAYAALSRNAIEIAALYAAPFSNQRISKPEDGMERSYDEIGRVLEALRISGEVPVLKGARTMMQGSSRPVDSPAARDIVERVMSPDSPVDYIVSIGAATNIASALLMESEIGRRATVVWLGGTPHHFPSASEFNLRQDPEAARVLFDSEAQLFHVPAPGLAENLRTTRQEIERMLRGNSSIGTYLADMVASLSPEGHVAAGSSRTLAIWDLAAVAWVVNPGWVESIATASPVVAGNLEWLHSPYRHQVRVATRLLRDEIVSDLFEKLSSAPR